MQTKAGPVGVADIERILEIAKRLPVFPCGTDKRPRVAKGFHAATQDEQQIRDWWRQWPDALVGVPTGQATRLVVVDYDPDKANAGTHSWMGDNTELLLSTRSHKTPRGGRHYLFRSNDRYMTGVDLVLAGSPRRGIDLRANGGYIIWWPAHLAQTDDTPVAQLPAGLIDERRFDAKRDMAPLPTATPESWRVERYKVDAALTHVPPDGYENWIRVGMAIHAGSGGSDEGFEAWHNWSLTGDSYDNAEDCRYHWASFGRYGGRGLHLGTLYAAAKEKGWMSSTPVAGPPVDPLETSAAPVPTAGRSPLNWPALSKSEPPQRKWAIPHWLGLGYMTLLAGPGGVGKTLLAQQLAAGLATGECWLEQIERPLRVLMWAGEDDHDELWRRQYQIAYGQRRDLTDYSNLIIESYAGRDCSLVEPIYGHLTPTKMMTELQEQVADYKADVVILDNVARMYGGDENVRHQVTQFVNWVSGACNARHPTAQLLLAHPAKIGGSEYAGSTAWEAAVRSRWFFGRTPPDEENPPTDENVRYLSRRKSNYSGLDQVKLEFDHVRLIFKKAEEEAYDNRKTINSGRAEKMITDAIKDFARQGIITSDGNRQANYIVKEMSRREMFPHRQARLIEQALFRLMETGKVRREVVGTYKNRTPREGLVVVESAQ
jgi:RecA-family ATPase